VEPDGLSILMVVGAARVGDRITYSHLISEQADSLRRAGVRVRVFGADDRYSLSGIRRNVLELRGIIREEAPDVLHAQYGSCVALICALAAGSTPLVVSFCGTDLLGLPGRRYRNRNALTRMAGIVAGVRAGAIVVKSKNLLRSLPGFLRRKATVVPNGVDTDFFIPRSMEDCRERLGWSVRSKVVLVNGGRGRGRETKNLGLARAAVSALRDTLTGVELREISEASRDEIALMLSASDCLLVTSHHEGSPNIVKEAMACDLPVVSVRCGDVEERLSDHRVGRLCRRDSEELALAMRDVLASGRRSSGRDAVVSQHLTAVEIGNVIVSLYATCVPARRSHRQAAVAISSGHMAPRSGAASLSASPERE